MTTGKIIRDFTEEVDEDLNLNYFAGWDIEIMFYDRIRVYYYKKSADGSELKKSCFYGTHFTFKRNAGENWKVFKNSKCQLVSQLN